ncbi:hypothetical protein Tco_1210784 [Tanacetum coccineum]
MRMKYASGLHEFERLEVFLKKKARVGRCGYRKRVYRFRRVIRFVARLEAITNFSSVCCSLNMVHLSNGCETAILIAPRGGMDMLSSFLLSNDSPKASVDLLCSSVEKARIILISQSPRGIFINQSKYALESLKKYGYESCDLVDTPMVEKSKLDEDKEGKACRTITLSWFHFIKELLRMVCRIFLLCSIEYQLADIFTKALGRERIEFLINKLGMRSFTPDTLKQLADEVDE